MDYLQETRCVGCSEIVLPERPQPRPWQSTALGLVVLLLPKCPFCVVAYTSSMAICGAPSLTEHHTDWGAWLAIGLAVLCLGSIARNYRGAGTRTAIVMAFVGICLLVTGLFIPNAMGWYYAGAALLFLSSFYNGRGYRWAVVIGHRLRAISQWVPAANDR
jgi:hypothetical protein